MPPGTATEKISSPGDYTRVIERKVRRGPTLGEATQDSTLPCGPPVSTAAKRSAVIHPARARPLGGERQRIIALADRP